MANIMKELKAEISRLARREITKELAGVKRIQAAQRGLIADLRRQLTAVQNVLLVLPDDRQEAAIRQDFARLGLDEAALALPARKLSGGQKRRTALLRALWAPGDTLLLDEPFTGMDPAAVQASIALLRERVEGRPVLLATHDRAAIDALGWPMLELQKLAQPGAACNSTNKGLQ